MMKLIYATISTALFTTVTFTSAAYADESCSASANSLHASYQATQTLNTENTTRNIQVDLWRQGNVVMHSYPNGTGDIWHKLPKNQMRMDKYFDQAKRLIEYEAADLTTLGKSKTWDSVNYLINKNFLTQLTKESETGSGCQITTKYSGEVNGTTYHIEWNPSLDLLVSMKASNKRLIESWNLAQLDTQKSEVETAINQRFKYMTTDFADIGDNEADPFLIKMINLGYIDHAPQAVYDANGNNIAQPAHSHEHGHSH
ncbi:hypothetical protein [Neptunomonas phycophila]|uniref:hypothetical protein n=1 Tax=Neptunomonas phycophila TaxID=1572645 RepID=UPI0030FD0958